MNTAEKWTQLYQLATKQEATIEEAPAQPQRATPWQCSYPGCERLTRNYVMCDEHTRLK